MNESIRQQFEKHYLEKVAAFIGDVADVDATGIPEIHLPLWGTNYETAKLRIAFVGMETKYWGDMGEFIGEAKQNPQTAIFRNEAWFHEFKFLESTNNFGTSFFDAVMQFLALFHNIPDWHELKARQYDGLLRSFVWAETNAIERHTTEAHEGVNSELWGKLKAASRRHLDSYSAMADIFRPHIVVVMDTNSDPYFLGSAPERDPGFEEIGDHLWYGRDPVLKTHIFNTAHPNYFFRNTGNATFETVSKKWKEICAQN